jgi:thioredoxin-like negative regulator of GroEL
MLEKRGGRSFLATFGLIFLSIAALFAADTFLARTERAESRVEAARLFDEGKRLMQRGQNGEAISRIKDALVIERDNREYRLTLAETQLEAARLADAEATIAQLLQSDSTDGAANLTMARVLVKEGRFEEASSYYHRAIFGEWKRDANGNRLRARFELIDLLAQREAKEELLAELLPVQDEAPHELKTRIRIGRLFLLAGSSSRAADVFHAILQQAPANADAYAGLGDAEFARGNYRAAQQAFRVALRSAPGAQATRQRLAVCTEVLTLDPTSRGLGPGEHFRRSVKLVELVTDETSQCAGQNPSPELRGLLDEAGKMLKAHVTAAHQGEASESCLDLAERLWQARKKECTSPLPADSPVALVLARIAQ